MWETLMVDCEQMKKPHSRSLGTSSNGFTIVELLIVVVVIAILAAITIVAYNGISTRAKDAAVQSAAEQGLKKVETAKVLNAGSYPTDLDAAGLTAATGAQYQYTTSDAGYCLTASQGGRSAYVASNYSYNDGTLLNQANPATGACPGHSTAGGTIIRNLVTNPSFETGASGYTSSAANIAVVNTWASSGSQSLRVTNTGTGNSGDARITSSSTTMPFGMQPGKTYTISARVNYPVAPTGGLGRAPGILVWYSLDAGAWNEDFGAKSPATPGTYTVSKTISLPSNTTGVLIGFGVASTTVSQVFYYDSFMVTEGSTVYPYADGSSANWVWTGAPNASSSTGPAL